MCRHLGYLGTPVSLAELLLAPAHSLLEQSWAPNDMRGGGTVNADGFGAGWFRHDGTTGTYRNGAAMWTDTSFPALARELRVPAVVAAVRSATVGMPVGPELCAPLTDGRWLFSHNGKVGGWPDTLAKLASRLDPADLLTAQPTDSAVLWALLRQLLDDGAAPEDAVPRLVREVHAAAPESRLNLLLSDGTRIVATTWTHSLWVRREPGAVTVTSEPFGPADPWVEIPDRCLVVADAEHTEVVSLGEDSCDIPN
ncbi:ergothioneine biosynthesis protein EgtC [Saccharopolyspora sp. TS4A08]|uniref:Gamma-glutamyl-hercynylcysteine sulfoxide hydrolase n=1 Tax=Saccharopolyspora ipomoeae TaxID=3042027 RepID=A0ABT6PNA1_9PSEU|nr:ergothioneine biosynthesis protein EgtC [Saccharopolyspora sp. TS4A08]MDI2029493.1 ergothioneine biosynthesis protein EgtC [Saccharopolyspora sp. TS4A08]